jgi:hypothetical protein
MRVGVESSELLGQAFVRRKAVSQPSSRESGRRRFSVSGLNVHSETSIISSRHLIAYFKASEGLHPPYSTTRSHQHSVASFATLRVLNCLHSPGLCCSCCNIVRFCCGLDACSLLTATIALFNSIQRRVQLRNQVSSLSSLDLKLSLNTDPSFCYFPPMKESISLDAFFQ